MNQVWPKTAWGLGCILVTAAAARGSRTNSQASTCQARDEKSLADAAGFEAWLGSTAGAEARKLFQELASMEVPVQVWCTPRQDGGCLLHIIWSQANLSGSGALKYATGAEIASTGKILQSPGGFCWDLSNSLAAIPSRNGEFMLVVREAAQGRKGSVLQVWGHQRLLCQVDINARVLTDAYFAAFDWDPTGRRICFVAEPTPRAGPFLGEKNNQNSWHGEPLYEPDWGEQLTGVRQPCIFVLDVDAKAVTQLTSPKDMSCGHCVWAPNGQEVVCTAWPLDSLPGLKRPGMIYCYNRPSALYAIGADGKSSPIRITPDSMPSASSPSFSPDGKVLAFLSNSCAVLSGSHDSTQELFTLAWNGTAASSVASKPRVILPAMDSSRATDEFPGLYCGRISPDSWSSNRTLIAQSRWRSDEAVISVDVDSGSLERLTPVGKSYGLLAVCGDLVVARVSSPSSPPQLMIRYVSGRSKPWQNLHVCSSYTLAVENALRNVRHETITYKPEGARDCIEAVVVHPKEAPEKALPVLHMHGGPHTSFPTAWNWMVAGITSQGRSVIMPNYRGSTGFGENVLQSLPGKIGSQDVKDCLEGLYEAHTRQLCADPDAAGVSCLGGSHGGFLTAHCAGQRPNIVRAAVLRNPVCDISTMVALTDIPDWCFKEALGDLGGFTLLPTNEDLAAMRACSPAVHASAAASVPHLFCLGAKDARVPPSQGLLYAKLLREKGAEAVDIVNFPEDCHPLSRPRTAVQFWLMALYWITKHHS